MSRTDHRKPVTVGEVLGTWRILREAESDAHFGVRAHVACIVCGATSIKVLTALRSDVRKGKARTHRGCVLPTSKGAP